MKQRFVAAISAVVLVLLVPVAAAAQTTESTIAEIEVGLVALFPLVILITSLFLSPEANEKVKVLLPAGVSIVVSALYFVVEAFPGFGAELLVQVSLLIALAAKLYEPASALIRFITGFLGTEKGLNELTGPGLVGRPAYVEED